MQRDELTPGARANRLEPSLELGRVYARWRLAFLRSLNRFKGVETPAEDVLHDAVVKYMAAQRPPADAEETRAYLHKVAVNGAAEEVRERRSGRILNTVVLDEAGGEVAALATSGAFDPVLVASHRQRMARLSEALEELPERQREAFVLHRFDGWTQDEVAAQMGISRRMVVKHLARAMAYCEVRVQYANADQMREHHPAAGHSDDENTECRRGISAGRSR